MLCQTVALVGARTRSATVDRVSREQSIGAAQRLRDVAEPMCGDKSCSLIVDDATCVDPIHSSPRFEVNYHLVSFPAAPRIAHQKSASRPMTPLWIRSFRLARANWLEREIFALDEYSLQPHH